MQRGVVIVPSKYTKLYHSASRVLDEMSKIDVSVIVIAAG
jgi:hypothetical protein